MFDLVLKCVAVGGIGTGVVAARSLCIDPKFPPTRAFNRYVAFLDGYTRFLGLDAKPRLIATLHLVAVGVVCFFAATGAVPYGPCFPAVVAAAPALWLSREKANRVQRLELQVDGFLLAYANALRAVPSPGAALLTVIGVLQEPMRSEIDRVLKEMRVGASLEQAFSGMSLRLRNRTVDGALSAILIGMQVGGDLPGVLATTAAALREMQRLDGVVRTKTAEGKAQLWVLAVFPLALIYMFDAVEPGYFAPLQSSFVGYVISTLAVGFWLAALASARKILQVDI
jgi:tight adherence protein B